MSASRRFHLLLPAELEVEAKAFGRAAGLALAPAVRVLVARGLEAEANGYGSSHNEAPALLATLTAAEHAVLMVASILPEGERRMRELGQRATVAAEERLALFAGDREGER